MTHTRTDLTAAPSTPAGARPLHVVVAGGGVAGVEAVLALRDLAGERVDVTVLSRDEDLVYRPMTVLEPFAYAPARHYPLREIIENVGGRLVHDQLKRVDTVARMVHTSEGEALAYDALILALGARVVRRFEHALTVDDRHMDEFLHGLVQDVEGGYVKRLAFVVPARMAWPLPLYELALMTAHRAFEANIEMELSLVTPEAAPLAIFGSGASAGVARLLSDAGVQVMCSAHVQVPESGVVVIHPGERRLHVDRVVALPELYGPSVHGLPVGEHGFLAVDPYGQVRGSERVFGAGDATDFPIKHGGIASQQADVAARSVAVLAGAPLQRERFRPEIRGILLTGARPKYLSARITGGAGFASEITDTPSWSPPAKIAAKYLGPYLADLDRAPAALR